MTPSLISFIVPAHNEAHEIDRCLRSIFDSAQAVGRPFEVVVVNDASTDETAQIAQRLGAHVIDVKLRKISAVRNAGARTAKGEFLFFVDADTRLPADTLRAALRALDQGAVGGGSWVRFAEPMPWWIQFGIYVFSVFYMRLVHWAAGCFVYARQDAFQAVGGFDEALYACEEIALSRALKRQGRFVVLRESVATSGRKMHMYSSWRIVPLLARLAVRGASVFRQREGLDWWYEGKREK